MASTEVRRAQGRWPCGTSGNPRGRPPGRRNKSTLYLQQLLTGKADQVIRAVVGAAISGDMRAAKLVLERILPLHGGRPMDAGIAGAISNASDATTAIASIATAALDGRLSTSEAADLSAVVESYRRALHTADVVARLETLELRVQQRDADRQGVGHGHR